MRSLNFDDERSRQRNALEALLAPEYDQFHPLSEKKFLEALAICHQLGSRYINYNRVPGCIKLDGIKKSAKLLSHKSKGKIEGSIGVSYDTNRDKFKADKISWGDNRGVEIRYPKGEGLVPSFLIHNHPDDSSTNSMVSMYSEADFNEFLSNPHLQFMVMITSARIFLILKTTKTAEAFLYNDLQQVVDEEEQKFRKEESDLKKKKRRQLTLDEFVEISSNFNAAVCQKLKLAFYASDFVPNKFRGSRPVNINHYTLD